MRSAGGVDEEANFCLEYRLASMMVARSGQSDADGKAGIEIEVQRILGPGTRLDKILRTAYGSICLYRKSKRKYCR